MRKRRSRASRIVREEPGQTFVEYGFIILLVVLIVIGVLAGLGWHVPDISRLGL
ncbi:MAG: hypothetical protein IRZ33_01775 [Alicyclobacillaceae bacterium]|nr:hypothetical protein [Alicyclobacillaceae bacterium]